MKKSFTSITRAEWEERPQRLKGAHPVIIRGNSKESAMVEVESNCTLFGRLLSPQPGDVFLEVGCGNSLYLQRFAPRVHTALGLDLSHNMLKLAKTDASQAGIRLQLAQGSAHQLPFATASIDKLLNNAMLEYLPPAVLPEFFGEIRRVLKPGGLALISEFPLRWCLYGIQNRLIDIARNIKRGLTGREPVFYNRYTPSGCARAIEQAGLRIVCEQTQTYGTVFLPAALGRRIQQRCEQRGTYSTLFSCYYLFLCTRDEH